MRASGPSKAAGESGDAQPIFPDGRAELIVHLGDPFERDESGRFVRQAPVLFAGQLREQITLRPTGDTAVLGVRFRSDGASTLLRIPQHELVGLTIDTAALCGTVHRAVNEARESARSLDEAAIGVEERLAAHVARGRVDARIRWLVDAIHARRGRVSIEHLASRCGLSRRQVERRFNDLVGVSPKRLARIARFQRALAILDRASSGAPGTTTAAECGYADQAHFIRDFKDLAGCPPGEHLLRRGELTGFFVARDPV